MIFITRCIPADGENSGYRGFPATFRILAGDAERQAAGITLVNIRANAGDATETARPFQEDTKLVVCTQNHDQVGNRASENASVTDHLKVEARCRSEYAFAFRALRFWGETRDGAFDCISQQ